MSGKARTTKELKEHILKTITVDLNGCWVWGGYKVKGYGRVYRNNRQVSVHRLIWEFYKGPIPQGVQVLHKCDNPSCSNPEHLFLGTQKDNVHDCMNKGRFVWGEKNGMAKITRSIADSIRSDCRPSRLVAKENGVDQKTVLNIRHGKSWRQSNGQERSY